MKRQKHNDNRVLVGVLCTLTAVMVALILGITIVKVNKYNSQVSDESSQENDESKEKTGEGTVTPMVAKEESDEGDNEGSNNDGGNNGGSSSGEPNQTEEEQEQVQEQIAIERSVKKYIRQMSVDEALEYLDTRIEAASDADDMFSMRLIKINVLNNANRHEDALAEAKKIDNVEELSRWNKCEYYNMMAYTYEVLGDTENENEYGALYLQARRDLWGDPLGSE